MSTESVDNIPSPPALRGLGLVIPKRHARRSVTRQLIRRQIRAVGAASGLSTGDWVVRLRGPFDRRQFPSAASEPLRCAVRAELDQLFGAAGLR